MRQEVVLVDESDRPIGIAEKQKAHLDGVLHRAFSIFVFNASGQLLLQRRARHKYHSAGLWSNSCCGHPGPGEALEEAARRRLHEEMGFECKLMKAFQFRYRAVMPNGLIEHEVDHVFLGVFNGTPRPNPEEADGWRRSTLADLALQLGHTPEAFTYWLHHSFGLLVDHVRVDPLSIVQQLGIRFVEVPVYAG